MISFVFFDLGGVVIKDFSGTDNWEKLKSEWGVSPSRDSEFDTFFNEIERQSNEGRDIETAKPEFEKRFRIHFPPNHSLLSDFVRRFEKNESIWPTIEFTKNNFRIGLLTNMYPNMLLAIKNKGILPEIDWEIIVDSSVERVAKPAIKIFQIAQSKAGVPNGEILLVENTKNHVEVAKKLGWQTFLYNSANPEVSSGELLVYLSDQLGTPKDHSGDQLD